ncbi:hypothetical protein B0T26DRAFT_675757 [Lasiosphaeria miniovina]|uniref:Uncharacterized protein n=1 Tax=Lasiosphaeria miniovina TaxID=1954250 RepID=A0AA40AKB5_9PEZI|nr:uncharacterized protein B0T26DRAFT_675757 [Lasiosphaeria miniovina]KAK0717451.1 hypothetical protein B0T26DRAFT_675757 [Lasiosphaeria miniovina]
MFSTLTAFLPEVEKLKWQELNYREVIKARQTKINAEREAILNLDILKRNVMEGNNLEIGALRPLYSNMIKLAYGHLDPADFDRARVNLANLVRIYTDAGEALAYLIMAVLDVSAPGNEE